MLSKILGRGEAAQTVPFAWQPESPPLPPEPPPLPEDPPLEPEPEPEAEPAGPSEADQLRAEIALMDRQADERASEAYANGVRDGEAEASASLSAHIKALEERLQQTLTEVAGLRTSIVRQAEQDLVRLALDIARRVLHQELEQAEHALDGLVRVSLDRLAAREIVRVRVHPDVEPAVQSALQRMAPSRNLEIVADSTQPTGGLVFETAAGRLDSGLESQMREIERGMLDCLENQ